MWSKTTGTVPTEQTNNEIKKEIGKESSTNNNDDDNNKEVSRRLVSIRAIRLDGGNRMDGINTNEDENDDSIITTKIVHFQRHGQGWHNLLGDILRDAGITPSVYSSDKSTNPWLRPETVDSPLTETGKEQCKVQSSYVASSTSPVINPQLIVVSPLLRTIQTAKITFAAFDGSTTSSADDGTNEKKSIPWIAHEGCREELGVLVCNKRRPVSEIKREYPELLFWNEPEDDEDTLWKSNIRESTEERSDRIYDFLTNFVMNRTEGEIAVIGHSAWLYTMCNSVIDCINDKDDENLVSWFQTSEIRSMKLIFSSTPTNTNTEEEEEA